MKQIVSKARAFFRSDTILCVAGILAVISAFFVPPSADYISYIDFRVLALLFCLMLVVAGLQSIGVFSYVGEKLLSKVKNTTELSLILVGLCYFFSMFITNDVALITFVPFSVMLLTMAKQEKLLIPTIVLQTIAANLGSMLTPIGNPQNLYLYSTYSIPIGTFLLYMLPLSAICLVLLLAGIFLQKKAPVEAPAPSAESAPIPRMKLLVLLLLFAVCLCCVVRILSWPIMLGILVIAIFFLDRSLFKKVDYLLLLTFVFFFLFIGNMENIEAIANVLRSFIAGRELLLGVLFSQCISNVPAAILLSGFTDAARELLYGVNIGGLGTLIASLASVISYKLYCNSEGAEKGKYIKVFTLYNLVFLVLLFIAALLLL